MNVASAEIVVVVDNVSPIRHWAKGSSVRDGETDPSVVLSNAVIENDSIRIGDAVAMTLATVRAAVGQLAVAHEMQIEPSSPTVVCFQILEVDTTTVFDFPRSLYFVSICIDVDVLNC